MERKNEPSSSDDDDCRLVLGPQFGRKLKRPVNPHSGEDAIKKARNDFNDIVSFLEENTEFEPKASNFDAEQQEITCSVEDCRHNKSSNGEENNNTPTKNGGKNLNKPSALQKNKTSTSKPNVPQQSTEFKVPNPVGPLISRPVLRNANKEQRNIPPANQTKISRKQITAPTKSIENSTFKDSSHSESSSSASSKSSKSKTSSSKTSAPPSAKTSSSNSTKESGNSSSNKSGNSSSKKAGNNSLKKSESNASKKSESSTSKKSGSDSSKKSESNFSKKSTNSSDNTVQSNRSNEKPKNHSIKSSNKKSDVSDSLKNSKISNTDSDFKKSDDNDSNVDLILISNDDSESGTNIQQISTAMLANAVAAAEVRVMNEKLNKSVRKLTIGFVKFFTKNAEDIDILNENDDTLSASGRFAVENKLKRRKYPDGSSALELHMTIVTTIFNSVPSENTNQRNNEDLDARKATEDSNNDMKTNLTENGSSIDVPKSNLKPNSKKRKNKKKRKSAKEKAINNNQSNNWMAKEDHKGERKYIDPNQPSTSKNYDPSCVLTKPSISKYNNLRSDQNSVSTASGDRMDVDSSNGSVKLVPNQENLTVEELAVPGCNDEIVYAEQMQAFTQIKSAVGVWIKQCIDNVPIAKPAQERDLMHDKVLRALSKKLRLLYNNCYDILQNKKIQIIVPVSEDPNSATFKPIITLSANTKVQHLLDGNDTNSEGSVLDRDLSSRGTNLQQSNIVKKDIQNSLIDISDSDDDSVLSQTLNCDKNPSSVSKSGKDLTTSHQGPSNDVQEQKCLSSTEKDEIDDEYLWKESDDFISWSSGSSQNMDDERLTSIENNQGDNHSEGQNSYETDASENEEEEDIPKRNENVEECSDIYYKRYTRDNNNSVIKSTSEAKENLENQNDRDENQSESEDNQISSDNSGDSDDDDGNGPCIQMPVEIDESRENLDPQLQSNDIVLEPRPNINTLQDAYDDLNMSFLRGINPNQFYPSHVIQGRYGTVSNEPDVSMSPLNNRPMETCPVHPNVANELGYLFTPIEPPPTPRQAIELQQPTLRLPESFSYLPTTSDPNQSPVVTLQNLIDSRRVNQSNLVTPQFSFNFDHPVENISNPAMQDDNSAHQNFSAISPQMPLPSEIQNPIMANTQNVQSLFQDAITSQNTNHNFFEWALSDSENSNDSNFNGLASAELPMPRHQLQQTRSYHHNRASRLDLTNYIDNWRAQRAAFQQSTMRDSHRNLWLRRQHQLEATRLHSIQRQRNNNLRTVIQSINQVTNHQQSTSANELQSIEPLPSSALFSSRMRALRNVSQYLSNAVPWFRSTINLIESFDEIPTINSEDEEEDPIANSMLLQELLDNTTVVFFFDESTEAERCNICLSDYVANEILRRLPCFHTYHRHCIDQWLTRERRTCPNCRTYLSSHLSFANTNTDANTNDNTDANTNDNTNDNTST